MAQIHLMECLQHIVGGHREEMTEGWAIQIFMHLLWMPVLTPFQPPATLSGATHPPGFLCLGVFPFRMRSGICQEATIIKFCSRSKKDYYLLLHAKQHEFFATDSSRARTCFITRPEVWFVSLKILLCCEFLQLTLKTIVKHQCKCTGILISKATCIF